MEKKMEKEHRRLARAQLVTNLEAGQPWQVAAATAGVKISQSTAYRLRQAVQMRGEAALQDGRHGHPIKLRGAARQWLEDYCRDAPCTSSSTIQTELRERFDLSISVSQINRVRAALGVSKHPKSQEQGKKRE